MTHPSSSLGIEPMMRSCFGAGMRLSRPLIDFQMDWLSWISGAASSRLKSHASELAASGASAPLTS